MPRRSPVTSWLRHLRAGSLATVIVVLAVGAHVLGGGGTPSVSVVGVCAALVMLCCTVATGRRLSAVAITAILGGAQLVLHHVFSIAGAVTSDQHGVSTAMVDHLGSAPVVSAGMAPAGGHGEAMMVLTHGVATVICALALTLGERALWALWTALSPALPPTSDPAPVPTPPRHPPIMQLLHPRTRLLRWRRTQRRGPPGVLFVSPA
jgi:hypothetical protein